MYTLHIRVSELEIYFLVLVKIQSVPTSLVGKNGGICSVSLILTIFMPYGSRKWNGSGEMLL
jgi:hypothetical protein